MMRNLFRAVVATGAPGSGAQAVTRNSVRAGPCPLEKVSYWSTYCVK